MVTLLCCFTAFSEEPSNETINLGSVELAVCRCRHTLQEAIIGWRINGLPADMFPDIVVGSLRENGNLVHTLSIPARSEYNGTIVVCVALFTNGSPPESTPPASVIFYAGLYNVCTTVIPF